MLRPLLLPLLLLALHAPAQSPSFPCTAAHTHREKAVCASPDLATTDHQLAAAYTALRASLSPAAAAQVQADQRNWLAWLDRVCETPAATPTDFARCLINRYNTRLNQLAPITTPSGFHLYTRAHFVFKAAPKTQPGAQPDLSNPGFGYGEFTWLQIDNPDNDQTLWNTALQAAALRIEGTRGKGKAPSLDLLVETDGYVYGYATLTAANDRLLAVSFDTGGYNWGGAHGSDQITTFSWWLRSRRPLAVDDVFRLGSAWQQPLAALATTSLKATNDSLWQGKELTDAVRTGVAEPAAWGIAANGLTITFGEYAVGPYAIGMPTVTLPWPSLNSLLSPNLNPETLPAPMPQSPQPPSL